MKSSLFFFFFSSRRRHTRCSRDWSSDVCSSDLPEGTAVALLAPLVSERKGEHQEVLGGLAGQGFVRVRIDGRIHEMDALPELDGKRKHTIEAVVDRPPIRADSGQRLAESLAAALRLSGRVGRLAVLAQ